MQPAHHHPDPRRPPAPAPHRRKGPVLVTVVLLVLGALGIATPALLPNADAAPVDTSTQATTVQTPPLLSDGAGASPSAGPDPTATATASAQPEPTPSAEPEPTDAPAERPTPARTGADTDVRPQPRPAGRPEADLAMERRVLILVNRRRDAAGCRAVTSNQRLYRASSRHSNDMAQKDYFSHTGADGSTPWDRAERAGYTRATAENLAAGQRTPEEVVQAWMDSPAHRKNLLDCRSRAIGVALARGGSYGIYWTQMFGSV